MSAANVGWGSPQIVWELHKLGIDVAKSTMEKHRMRSKTPTSPTWKAFLTNHARDLVSVDLYRGTNREIQGVVRLGGPLASSSQGSAL
jgi:hypothetical protein